MLLKRLALVSALAAISPAGAETLYPGETSDILQPLAPEPKAVLDFGPAVPFSYQVSVKAKPFAETRYTVSLTVNYRTYHPYVLDILPGFGDYRSQITWYVKIDTLLTKVRVSVVERDGGQSTPVASISKTSYYACRAHLPQRFVTWRLPQPRSGK